MILECYLCSTNNIMYVEAFGKIGQMCFRPPGFDKCDSDETKDPTTGRGTLSTLPRTDWTKAVLA